MRFLNPIEYVEVVVKFNNILLAEFSFGKERNIEMTSKTLQLQTRFVSCQRTDKIQTMQRADVFCHVSGANNYKCIKSTEKFTNIPEKIPTKFSKQRKVQNLRRLRLANKM